MNELLSSFEGGANLQLPEPDLVSYYALEDRRCIFLEDQVDSNIMTIIRMILRWNAYDKDHNIPVEKREPITIVIMNYGGDVDYMWALIDVIEASQTPVRTVNIGNCCSAAALIFMAGHERLMMKRAKVLIHEGSASMSGDSTKILDATESYRKVIKAMKEYIAERTSIPKSVLNKKRNNDWEIDSEYCLEHQVCTKIIVSLEEILT